MKAADNVESSPKITDHPQKWVECDKCAAVFKLTEFIPLKLSCCKQCGSVKIRLYKNRNSGLWELMR